MPLRFFTLAAHAIVITACGKLYDRPGAAYLPLTQVEAAYGPLITAGNHPTPDHNGTAERVGLFQDASGAAWGLPLAVTSTGEVLACAPPQFHDGRVTDTFLELLLRDARGIVRRQTVRGAQLPVGPVCRVPDSPGPQQQLHYYRITHASLSR